MTAAIPTQPAAGYVRYWVIGTLFLLTTINYASRATLSIAGEPLSQELGVTPLQMGYLFSAFADRKSTRLNSSHITPSRMPSSA